MFSRNRPFIIMDEFWPDSYHSRQLTISSQGYIDIPVLQGSRLPFNWVEYIFYQTGALFIYWFLSDMMVPLGSWWLERKKKHFATHILFRVMFFIGGSEHWMSNSIVYGWRLGSSPSSLPLDSWWVLWGPWSNIFVRFCDLQAFYRNILVSHMNHCERFWAGFELRTDRYYRYGFKVHAGLSLFINCADTTYSGTFCVPASLASTSNNHVWLTITAGSYGLRTSRTPRDP